MLCYPHWLRHFKWEKKIRIKWPKKNLCYFRFFYLILWSWWYNIWKGGNKFHNTRNMRPILPRASLGQHLHNTWFVKIDNIMEWVDIVWSFFKRMDWNLTPTPMPKLSNKWRLWSVVVYYHFAAHLLKANHYQNHHNHHPSHLTGLMSDFAIPAAGHPNIASRLNSICVAATWPFNAMQNDKR